MSDHTPTVQAIKDVWVMGGAPFTSPRQRSAEFDRAIAKVKADAWDEGFAEFERGHHASNYEPWEHTEDNPYRTP